MPTSVCCELCYKYEMYLAPFTAILTIAMHTDFNKNKNVDDTNKEDVESE